MKFREPVLPVLIFGLVGMIVPAVANGQTIVATARSFQELSDDLTYLIEAVAPEGDPQVPPLLARVRGFRDGQVIKGLDMSRRIGIAITLPRDFPAGEPPTIVAAVPASDLGALMGSLQGLGFAVDDQPGIPGFSHKVTAPDGQTNLFVVNSKGYALFSMVPAGAEKLRAMAPSAWSPKGRAETLAATIRLSEIPPAIQQQFLSSFRQTVKADEARQPGESEATYQGRLVGQRAMARLIEAMVQQGESLEMMLDLDRKAGRIAAAVSISAKPGTEMAGALRSIGGRRSLFTNPDAGGPFALRITLPMAGFVRQGLSFATEQGARAQRARGFRNESERKLFDRFTELIRTNLKADEIDAAMAFRPAPHPGGGPARYTGVLGLRVREGKAFDQLFRESVALQKGEEKKDETLTLDADRSSDGTAIHQLAGPVTGKDVGIFRTLGEKATVRFGFRDDAFVLVFGEDSAKVAREQFESLVRPGKAAAGPDVPVSAVARLSQFGTFPDGARERESYRRAESQAFRGKAANRDRVAMVLEGQGDSIRIRMEVDVPVLRFLVSVGKAAR